MPEVLRDATGPLLGLAAVLGGVMAAHAATPSGAVPWLALAACCGLAAAAWPRQGGRALVALVAVALLAFALTGRARHGLVASPLDEAMQSRATASVVATLVSDPAPRRWETTVEVRVHRFSPMGPPGVSGEQPDRKGSERAGGERHVMARAARPTSSRLAVLSAGDRVTVIGRFEPLRPFDASRRDLHLVGGLRVEALVDVRDPRSPLMRVANRARGVVLGGVEHVPAGERALVAGFLLGDTRGLARDLSADFRRAGLSHLLVVSGSNVAFVLAVAGPLRRRLGLGGRFAVGLAVVAVFAAATRFEPSVLRASTMAALSMTAAFAGRRASGLRLLALAATGLLLLDPLLVHSIAFRLSCGASAGILLWSRRLAERIPGPPFVTEPLATTAAAQAGVAPVLTGLSGGLPLVALPANLAAAWAAGPLTVWGLVAAVASRAVELVSPEVAAALHLPTGILARYLVTVADLAAGSPFALGRSGLVAAALAVVGAPALVALRRRPSTSRLDPDGAQAPDRPPHP